MRTIIYVDAFNLYYGCLKGTPYRWLNIQKLCELLMPKNNIVAVKYFTALVSERPNVLALTRKRGYLTALNDGVSMFRPMQRGSVSCPFA